MDRKMHSIIIVLIDEGKTCKWWQISLLPIVTVNEWYINSA